MTSSLWIECVRHRLKSWFKNSILPFHIDWFFYCLFIIPIIITAEVSTFFLCCERMTECLVWHRMRKCCTKILYFFYWNFIEICFKWINEQNNVWLTVSNDFVFHKSQSDWPMIYLWYSITLEIHRKRVIYYKPYIIHMTLDSLFAETTNEKLICYVIIVYSANKYETYSIQDQT